MRHFLFVKMLLLRPNQIEREKKRKRRENHLYWNRMKCFEMEVGYFNWLTHFWMSFSPTEACLPCQLFSIQKTYTRINFFKLIEWTFSRMRDPVISDFQWPFPFGKLLIDYMERTSMSFQAVIVQQLNDSVMCSFIGDMEANRKYFLVWTFVVRICFAFHINGSMWSEWILNMVSHFIPLTHSC